MNDFLKKLVGFSVGPIISALLGVVIVPLTTYFIAPEQYGKASMFTLVQTILCAIVYLGLDQSFIVYYHEIVDKKKLFINSLILPMSVVFVCLLISPIIAKQLSELLFSSGEYTTAIFGLFLMLPFVILSRFILLTLRMKEDALAYSLSSIVVNLATFFVTLIFVLSIRQDFLAVVYSTIIGQIVGNLILILKYREILGFDIKLLDKVLFLNLAKYGLPFIFAILVGWALNSMDQIFLRYYSSFEELGYYSIALRLSSMLLIIQTSFSSFWTPTSFRWNKEKMPYEYFEMISQGLSFVMSFFFLLIMLFRNFIPLMLSSAYEDSIYILPFLLFYPIFFTMSETTASGIYFQKKSYLTVIVSVCSLLANLFLNFLLVPNHGARGAALATGIAYLVFFWTRTLISRKLWYPMKLHRFVAISVVLSVVALFNTLVSDVLMCSSVNIIAILIIVFVHKGIIIHYITNRKNQ